MKDMSGTMNKDQTKTKQANKQTKKTKPCDWLSYDEVK